MDSCISSAPASVLVSAPAPDSRRAWGAFWRLFTAWSGALLCLAAVVCFFAYNWAVIPAFAKFALIGVLMAASGILAVYGGFFSLPGKIGALLCGFLAGSLLAVYGQVYQTGADAWELFRAWTLVLLPLALLARQTGLWFLLWLVGALWAGLYGQQVMGMLTADRSEQFSLYIAFGESVCFLAWEAAAYFWGRTGSRGRAFLRARWLPRSVGFCLMLFLAGTLALHNLEGWRDYAYTEQYWLLFLALLAGGAFWYTRVVHDLFLIASGLLGILIVLLAHILIVLLVHILPAGRFDISALMMIALLLIAYAAGAGKLLIALHRAAQPSGPLSEAPSAESAPGTPWPARLLTGFSAWLAVPFICWLLFLLEFTQHSVGFLALLGVGLLLSASTGSFVSQLSLCLCLAGAVGASLIDSSFSYGYEFSLLPMVVIFAASGVISRSAAYRCIASCVACVALVLHASWVTADLWVTGEMKTLPWIFAACTAVLSGFLVHFWCTRRLPERMRPTLTGVLMAFLFIGLLPLVLRINSMPLGNFEILRMTAIGAGVGLQVFACRLKKDLPLSRMTGFIIDAVAWLLIGLSFFFFMPWLGAGVLFVALARHAGSRPMLGGGILCLAGCVSLYYYSQDNDLLLKSLGLCALGVPLCALAAVLHRCLGGTEDTAPQPRATPAGTRRFSPSGSPSGVVFAACVLGFFLLFSWSVYNKEQLLRHGTEIILALRPVDPRSLMQGDYMRLDLELEQDIDDALDALDEGEGIHQGTALVSPDMDGVSRFAGLEGEEEVSGAARVVYRRGDRRVRVGSGSFFFQEGHAEAYTEARFAALRVDEDGNALITRLLDQDLQPIDPDAE